MARLRLIVEVPDGTAAETAALVARLTAACAPGRGLDLGVGNARTRVEACGVQLLDGPAQGLVLNVPSLAGDGLRDLRDLAGEVFPDTTAALGGPGSATLRRVLDGVEAVFVVDQRRFATPLEAARIRSTLRGRLDRPRG